MTIRSRRAKGPFLVPLLTRRQTWIYYILTFLWGLAAINFWVWWLWPSHVKNIWLFFAVTIPVVWIYLLQIYFLVVFLHAKRSSAPDPKPRQFRVAMITTKTPAEPFAVVKRTLEAMLAQDYPHDTWLADEDPSDLVTGWCVAHGVHLSTRKGREDYHLPAWPRRTRCKEGNLAFFYDTWGYRDYDIVSQLDADHVAQPGYLREMVRPFADPDVGYVSAPSICAANADQSWAARPRLYAEAAFHGVLQSGYTGFLAPMCIGSHYAVRTKALKAVGGIGPELAEDHSTTMLMNAGGWRGVHAIDAIAIGDGPASVADLLTQEFQWSRSLLSLLLNYTPRYFGQLPGRLKFLFVFCQIWYPLFALTSALMYFLPMTAIIFNVRFAEVTYPAFVGHSLPIMAVMIIFAYRIRHDGLFRPQEAPVLAWEKALFVSLQWPWVLWGCLMAVRDRITGKFVDFHITPKGKLADSPLPNKVLAVYVTLAVGCALPVLLVPDATDARGFYLFAVINAILYSLLVIVIIVHHYRESGMNWARHWGDRIFHLATVASMLTLIVTALVLRGGESVQVLAIGLEPLHITRVLYRASGAGSAGKGKTVLTFNPGWQ